MSQQICGIGIGYQPDLHEDTMANLSKYDFIEVAPENFIGMNSLKDNLKANEIRGQLPISLHGINLSLASSRNFEKKNELLRGVKEIANWFDSPFYSEHLSYTTEKEIDLDLYMPPIFNEASVENVIKNIKHVKNELGLDFHIENVASLVNYTLEADMTEGEYVSKVCEASDSGIILNLDSIAISSHTYKIDSVELLNSYPLHRVISITVVPESCMNPMLRKFYGTNIDQLMWSMLEYVFKNSPANSVLIQRRFPRNTTDSLKNELAIAKEIFKSTKEIIVK
ncbi:MbnB/TglH/ChrH family RiPP precursor modification enzyme [Bacillus chungangensis]|uniref:Uncharacterized protein (UPF0276 family) n=1 Tax=Bacillus chungangensis TaxID=587633 RepID=A0ABT9WSH2_9BACI|nr:DUF692 family multinuclear iron-containing protein [Bacillus chungangensis]MDQ0176248.1 uncharacterized protein (UPF0276 family) [Bacillus chungangensis]